MSAPAIEIHGLHRAAGQFALDQVELVLPTGYVMGLVGPNGAGKTTTIKAALGMVRPDVGEVRLLGRPPATAEVRQRVGVVLDEPFLAPDWTAAGAGRRLGRFYERWDARYFAELLDRFAVPATLKVRQLSRGQGMKLMLALALAHRPELLVLDEPTSGLDPVSRTDVIDVLREFMTDDQHSVLFSTHITSDLDGLADYLQVMVAGSIAFTGTLDSLGEEFAMVHGTGTPAPAAAAALLGRREVPDGFDGLIRLADSSRFDSTAVIEEATTDDVVVYLAREQPPVSGRDRQHSHPATEGTRA